MPLKAPNLDSRTFADLVAEARQRIPRFTPDWTNLNDSDPGMALVQLNAWLTETILYELNKVPELNYVKFLDLLQIRRNPARAARAELAVTLKKLSAPADRLTVLVPKGAKIEVDDPDLTEEVLFETDYTLVAINAAIGAGIVSRPGNQSLELITEYDDKTARTTWRPGFRPFGTSPVKDAVMLLGLVLRPHLKGKLEQFGQDVFPSGQLDIHVDASQPFDKVIAVEADGSTTEQVIDTAPAQKCRFPWEVSAGGARIEWQIYTGSNPKAEITGDGAADEGWTTLAVAGDETAGLTRSGHLRLEIPERISRASIDQLSRAGMWERMGLAETRPPESAAELLADLDADLEGLAGAMDEGLLTMIGVPEEDHNAVLSCDLSDVAGDCNTGPEIAAQLRAYIARELHVEAGDLTDDQINLAIDLGNLTAADWRKAAGDVYALPPMPAHDGIPRRLYWIRAVLRDAEGYAPAPLDEIRLNTVPATATSTILDERLGSSDGRPGQVFTLARTPVYFDPDKRAPDALIEVGEEQQTRAWERVDDFFSTSTGKRIGPEDEVYTLDETTGDVTFGDGKRGRIPIAGAAIRAVRYRTGGGRIGNVGRGAISKLRGAIRDVEGVTNPRPAADGSDAETLDEVMLRAPSTLRVRDRAVSQEDFAFLAGKTPGVAVHKAYAIAGRRYDPDAEPKLVPQAGSVTVVILPANDGETPLPSEPQLRAVCRYLEPRRLITTELHVAGPDYVRLSHLKATIRIAEDADIKLVQAAAAAAVLTFLHPLKGGDDGKGWPFGAPIYHADLYERLLALDGVRRVSDLSLGLEGGGASGNDADILAIPEGALPHLQGAVVDFKVIYDRFG